MNKYGTYVIVSIAGDAWEYMNQMKESLLLEVNREVEANDDYHSRLKVAINSYWDNFSHGSTDYITRCGQCNTTSTRSQTWCELIMYFPESHHTKNSTKNICTLGDLLTSYNTREDVIDGYYCGRCNRSTTATVHNRVRQYPRVLAIALSRGSESGKLIKTGVDYPFEDFRPYTHSNYPDDEFETTYDLVATINHIPRNKKGKKKAQDGQNGGHYTATCKQHNSGVWYDYNDSEVTRSQFFKIDNGVRTAKASFRRNAVLLFYIRRGSPTQDDAGTLTSRPLGNDDSSTSSSDKSRASNHSNAQHDYGQYDDRHIERIITTGLDQRNVDTNSSLDDATLFGSKDGSEEKVRVSISTAPIKLVIRCISTFSFSYFHLAIPGY